MKNDKLLMWVLIAVALMVFFSGYGMMGIWGYGFPGMMSMMYGYGLYGLASLFQLAYRILMFVALVLLVVWLWQKIQNKK